MMSFRADKHVSDAKTCCTSTSDSDSEGAGAGEAAHKAQVLEQLQGRRSLCGARLCAPSPTLGRPATLGASTCRAARHSVHKPEQSEATRRLDFGETGAKLQHSVAGALRGSVLEDFAAGRFIIVGLAEAALGGALLVAGSRACAAGRRVNPFLQPSGRSGSSGAARLAVGAPRSKSESQSASRSMAPGSQGVGRLRGPAELQAHACKRHHISSCFLVQPSNHTC